MFVSLLFSHVLGNDRNCENLRFCRDRLNTENLPYSFEKESVIFKDNQFEVPLLYNGTQTNATLFVYRIKDSGFRVRVFPGSELASYRYNITYQDLIVDSAKINAKDADIERKTTDTAEILVSDDVYLTIQRNPLQIFIGNSTTNFLTINKDNRMFIEDGSAAEPQQWEKWTETFPHGKTAVSMSFSFNSPNTYLTGFLEGMDESNLPDAEEDRRYARDGYSKYGVVPFFIGHTKDFGKITPSIFWMNPSDLMMKRATGENDRMVTLVSEGGFIDFVVFLDKIQNVLDQYQYLTGIQKMAPGQLLGYQQSKWGYESQKVVEEILQNLTDAGFPHDVTWLDIDHLDAKKPFTMNNTWFYDSEKMFNDAKDQKRIIIRIADPHMKVDPNYTQYSDANKINAFLQYNGQNFVASSWPGNSSWPDYLRSDVRQWWANQFQDPAQFPESVHIWNDMNEVAAWESMEGTIPKDCYHLNNTLEAREVHNIYGLSMTAATYDGLVKRGSKRPFILTRSFFAGSQKFTWHWSGDNDGNWEHLKISINTLLTANLNGMPFTGSDIGGFNTNTTSELQARWFQAGAFIYPLFRQHSSNSTVHREPYLFNATEPEIFDVMKEATVKRYKLLPLLYKAMHTTATTGKPFVSPLWYLYPEAGIDNVTYQPLVSNTLMVVPVLNEKQEKLTVVKPPGRWYDFETGEELLDTTTLNVTMHTIPRYIRGGKITAEFSKIGLTVFETFKNNLTLIIAVDEKNEANGKLYFDDLESDKYLSGDYVEVEIDYTTKELEFKSNGNGDFHPIIEKILIYGATEEPQFKIKGSNVIQKDGVYEISNVEIDASKNFTYDKNGGSLSETTIIIVVIVCIAIVAVIVVVGVIFYRKKKQSKAEFSKNSQAPLINEN